ncbi:MAG: hypothetical protein ACYTAN_07405, partial [Planctomycetota bacterium]
VRATDRYRALSCASAVKVLVVDGGQWAVSGLDFSALEPQVSWDHTGEGIVRYNVQISADPAFPRSLAKTVLVPARGVAVEEYTFSTADLRRISVLASRNSAVTLYYRIRGEDADRQFTAFSPAQSTAAP